ncbi:hypothetical protein, partial [Anaerotignum lactatifermentans]|uniref:hypothetical protein n=1 Tax=Anaerotignum lactatifermentans TaxID=160404 RepID=UPI003AB3E148
RGFFCQKGGNSVLFYLAGKSRFSWNFKKRQILDRHRKNRLFLRILSQKEHCLLAEDVLEL